MLHFKPILRYALAACLLSATVVTGVELRLRHGAIWEGRIIAWNPEKHTLEWESPDWPDPMTFPLAAVESIRETVNPAEARGDAKFLIETTDGSWFAARAITRDGDNWKMVPLIGDPFSIPHTMLASIAGCPEGNAFIHKGPEDASEWHAIDDGMASWGRVGDGLEWTNQAPAWRAFPTLPPQLDLEMEIEGPQDFLNLSLVITAGHKAEIPFPNGSLHVGINPMFLELGYIFSQEETREFDIPLENKEKPDADAAMQRALAGMINLKPIKQNWRVLADQTKGKFLVFRDGKKLGEWEYEPAKGTQPWSGLLIWPHSFVRGASLKLNKLLVRPWDGGDPSQESAPKQAAVRFFSKGLVEGTITKWSETEVSFQPTAGEAFTVEPKDVARVWTLAPMAKTEGLHEVELAGHGIVKASSVLPGETQWKLVLPWKAEWVVPTNLVARLSPPVGIEEPLTGWLALENGVQVPGLPVSAESDLDWNWQSSQNAPARLIPHADVMGLRLTGGGAAQPTGARALLHNGDLLGGEIIALDEKIMQFRVIKGDPFSLPVDQIETLYPAGKTAGRLQSGSDQPELWIAEGEQTAQWLNVRNGLTAAPGHPEWITYGKGQFEFRPKIDESSMGFARSRLSRGVEPSRRLEVSFRLREEGGNRFPQGFAVVFISGDDDVNFLCHYQPFGLSLYPQKPSAPGAENAGNEVGAKTIPLTTPRLLEPGMQEVFRFRFSQPDGTLEVLRNGEKLGAFQAAAISESKPIKRILLTMHLDGQNIKILDHLLVRPFVDPLPPEAKGMALLLPNGDAMEAKALKAEAGQFIVETEIGPLDLPSERLSAIQFPTPPAAAELAQGGRVVLRGGTVLTVPSWKLQDGHVEWESPGLGHFKVPLEEIRELGW
jgi:hypothetical protein